MTLYLKVLNEDRSSYHGGQGVWPPEGEWTPEPLDRSGNPGPLVPCGRGWHLIEPKDIVSWIGPALWEAEYEGEIVHDTDKVVVRKARLVRRIEAWNTRTLSLWAADCAEQTLGNFESLFPDDRRPRQAIEAVRGYAAGEIGLDELRSAESAARSARSARSAAWSAAWAAEAAARSAERDWQTSRLLDLIGIKES